MGGPPGAPRGFEAGASMGLNGFAGASVVSKIPGGSQGLSRSGPGLSVFEGALRGSHGGFSRARR
eukprot:7583297-Pyramimonas_sp.AAC.1